MRHRITPLFAVSAMVLSAAPVQADLGDQFAKLLADDGEFDDRFGWSVASSGATAIVGAIGDDDNGFQSGSAYLFGTITGVQIAKLLADDGAASDFFGISVGIDGTTAIVGTSTWVGSAYLFDTNTGQQLFKLLPDDDQVLFFGGSVAISGATAIVGAIGGNDNGQESGSAYLFDTTTGQQLFKLLPDDGAEVDQFGGSVAISGTTAIVGAANDDDACPGDVNCNSGSAYLFDTTTGQQIAKLVADDGAADDRFGFSVAISGTPGKEIAIVGAVGDDDNGNFSGSAYLFDISDPTNPRQIAKLLANDGAAQDIFGHSVAISGETVIVGAFGDDDNGIRSGSAYLFDTTTGDQIVKLLPDDGAASDEFGRSVAISGSPGEEVAIAGAYFDNENGGASGSAYLFDAGAPGNCPWDVNSDGVVNHHDIVEVVHNLGMCDDPDNCPWDVNGDGIVNGRDVAAVATHFGLCP